MKVVRNDGAELEARSVVETGDHTELHVAISCNVPMVDAVAFFDGAPSFRSYSDQSDGSSYAVYEGFSSVAYVTRLAGGRVNILLKKG